METIHLTLPISTQIPGSGEGGEGVARTGAGVVPTAGWGPEGYW
jgi:hypothetical protein